MGAPWGCDYTLDVTKGWYDAGDHGKYVVNSGISTWTLMNLFERSRAHNDPSFSDGTLNIPESGNGVPDLLDEVRWNLEFMLAMQVPQGEELAGMVHHKVHDFQWTGLGLAPHEDPQTRYLVPPSVTATLNLAATAAQCARNWRESTLRFRRAAWTQPNAPGERPRLTRSCFTTTAVTTAAVPKTTVTPPTSFTGPPQNSLSLPEKKSIKISWRAHGTTSSCR